MKSTVSASSILFLLFSCSTLSVTKLFEIENIHDKITSQHDRNDTVAGCELESFDETGLFNYVSRAIANEHCSQAAIDLFKRMFAKKLIKIGNHIKSEGIATVQNDTVLISDLKVAARTLEHFGHLASRLSFEFKYQRKSCTSDEEAENRKLLTYVNTYTHTSLFGLGIHFSGCDVDIFGEIINKFKNVSSVSIHTSQITTNTDHVRLAELFPNVHRLDLNLNRITDPNFIDGEAGLFYGVIETTFTNFMAKNPNITHMSIVSPTKRLLQIASKHLEELIDLRISQTIQEDSSCTKVHFPRVRTVVVQLSAGKCNPPRRIAFGSMLDEIALICRADDIGDKYFNFLLKYPNITKLSAGIGFSNSHLQKITNKLPNLEEAFLSFKKEVSARNIKEFLDFRKNMTILRFYHSSIENIDEFQHELNETLGDDFQTKYENGTGSKYFLVYRINVASTYSTCNAIIIFLFMYNISHAIIF